MFKKKVEVCIELWVKNRDTNRIVSLVYCYSPSRYIDFYIFCVLVVPLQKSSNGRAVDIMTDWWSPQDVH